MKTLILLGAALQISGVARAQTIANPASNPAAPVAAPSNEPPVDYAGAIWVPAAIGNFSAENRPLDETIDRVVVHDIEGPAAAAISIFQDPKRVVSAHYIVGGDGQIYQMVREHNVGFHAGNRDINHHSIGIETEGYAYRPGWYSPTIYEAEARLVRDITRRYAIPRDRAHIIGHFEVPNPKDPTKFGGVNGHTDPGPYWNWATFMTLVRNDSQLVSAQIPPTIRPGEILPVSVTLSNTGDDAWPTNTAKDPEEELQASGPLVVLGTENGRISSLYSGNFAGWIGPTIAAGALRDTLPGATSRFDFTLCGPRQLGIWRDELRLTTSPTTAQGGMPISFGAKVTVSTRVVPWVIDLATPSAPAPSAMTPKVSSPSTIAPSAPASEAPLPVFPDLTNYPALPVSSVSPALPATPAALATWNAALPIGGIYAVYVAPPRPAKLRDKTRFSYQFAGIDGLKTVTVKAEEGGKGWLFAGYFPFPEPVKAAPTATVTLQSAPRRIDTKDAGALRFIGPFAAASPLAPDLSQIPGALTTAP